MSLTPFVYNKELTILLSVLTLLMVDRLSSFYMERNDKQSSQIIDKANHNRFQNIDIGTIWDKMRYISFVLDGDTGRKLPTKIITVKQCLKLNGTS